MWSLNSCLPAFTKPLHSSLFLLAILVAVLVTPNLTQANGNNDGIKVHGDWVVTITNPDGSVAQRFVLQNALLADGQRMLTLMLAGIYKLAFRPNGDPAWNLNVMTTGVNPLNECLELTYNPLGPVHPSPVNAVISSYQDNLEKSFTLSRSFSLPASCIDDTDFAITRLDSATTMQDLDGTYDVSSIFSRKTLSVPITGILPDQVVTLKVTFSFE